MPTWLLIFFLVAGGLVAIKLAYVLATALSLPKTQGALYVSTTKKRIESFLAAIPMQPGQLFIDLGCGDRRVLRRVRKLYGVRALGYEINPLAYMRARLGCLGRSHLEVKRQDFRKIDLSRADVVFCYLFPDALKGLAPKLASELKPGARVVSANFPLPGWQADQVLRPPGSLHGDPIYLYNFPGAVSPNGQ